MKYEYKCVDLPYNWGIVELAQCLNDNGRAGWRLAHRENYFVVFEREKPQPKPRSRSPITGTKP